MVLPIFRLFQPLIASFAARACGRSNIQ